MLRALQVDCVHIRRVITLGSDRLMLSYGASCQTMSLGER